MLKFVLPFLLAPLLLAATGKSVLDRIKEQSPSAKLPEKNTEITIESVDVSDDRFTMTIR